MNFHIRPKSFLFCETDVHIWNVRLFFRIEYTTYPWAGFILWLSKHYYALFCARCCCLKARIILPKFKINQSSFVWIFWPKHEKCHLASSSHFRPFFRVSKNGQISPGVLHTKNTISCRISVKSEETCVVKVISSVLRYFSFGKRATQRCRLFAS